MFLYYEVNLQGAPDWAIPMMKVVPIFYTEDGYTLDDGSLVSTCNHLWEKIDNINWKLWIYLNVQFKDGINFLPLYLDLKLYFINKNNYYDISKFKK